MVFLEKSVKPIKEHKVVVVHGGGFPSADTLLHVLIGGSEVEGPVGWGEAIFVGGCGGWSVSRRAGEHNT